MKNVIRTYWTEVHGQRVEVKVYEAATKEDMEYVNRREVEEDDEMEDYLTRPKYRNAGDLVDMLDEQTIWEDINDEDETEVS